MSFIRNMKIRVKMLLGFFLVLAITVFIAVFGIVNINTVNTNYALMHDFPVARYNTLNYMSATIMDLSVEMLEGSKEVIQESKNLEKATQEITNGVNEMAAGAEQVNMAVNTVNDLTGRTRENISSLVQSVSKFRV